MRKLVLISLFWALPLAVFAEVSLFISPASGAYKTGEIFSVLVNVNTSGQPINAASAVVNFDNARLDVASVGYSQSILTLWTEEPKFSNAGGTIRFSGGLPFPGYNGANGAILRVTFRSKASGQAPVVFSSGSVLANDGKGTNILDTMRGAIFTIVAAVERPVPPPAAPPTAVPFETSERAPAPPTITDWPKELEEGSVLTIKGLAYPNGKVLIFVQKGSDDPLIEERFAGPDGRFTYNYSKAVEAGLKRIWAKSVSNDGVVSASSEIVMIEITKPLFFRIGSAAINYGSVIITLLALIILLILIIAWIWWRIRKWQERQGIEIHESEKALHDGFEKLRWGLRKYLRHITQTKSAEGIKRREAATEEELDKELKDIEGEIEKEIEDVSAVTKNKGHKHYGHDEFEHRK